MGRLAGFRYREIVRKLKALGFAFDRQAAGSHEIWLNRATNRYTTVPNHPGVIPNPQAMPGRIYDDAAKLGKSVNNS